MSKALQMETIIPLYISNLCDSDCQMCSMRASNKNLRRIVGTEVEIDKQLRLILFNEKISSLMLLSGEYKPGAFRNSHLARVQWCINRAFSFGFERITINIGALNETEIRSFYENTTQPQNLGLSIFQETYDRETYTQYFGTIQSTVPKTDYDFRYSTPRLWLEQGFSLLNMGILIGLGPVNQDVTSLIDHVSELKREFEFELMLSLPRIIGHQAHQISDSQFISVLRRVKQDLSDGKVILTTRESIEFLSCSIQLFDVISPGSSDVLAYSEQGIRNDPSTSQFFVSRHRKRPIEVLKAIRSKTGIKIKYFSGED